MGRVLLDEMIETDYGLFELCWGDYGFDGDLERNFAGQVNGLAGAASGLGLFVHLAGRSGGSPVRIVLASDPSPADVESWEDIVEVSIAIPPGAEVVWCTFAGGDGGDLDLPCGTYRVRVSAYGRDAAHQGEYAEGGVDRYLLELWPAPVRPDAIIKSTSADADYWHREVGSRRSGLLVFGHARHDALLCRHAPAAPSRRALCGRGGAGRRARCGGRARRP
ncbi:hypothetical protein AB0K52_10760 [Glycomyces sp. NPDC049804]|uniref:hypothetical protein n=1 Tax=Glycomyces sp. NPDC049804 TaxID=3154363 RepID=UPI00341BB43C